MTSRAKTNRVVLYLRCACRARARVTAAARDARALPACVLCAACQRRHELHRSGVTPLGGLMACVACGHPELHSRKRVSPKVGLAIVIVAACLAPITRYVSLFAAALLDLLLFWAMPEVVECYVCKAVHRGFTPQPRHPRFDHQIAERLRFGPRAVMGKPMRPTGTAGAPEPEH